MVVRTGWESHAGAHEVDPDAWFFKAHFLHDPVWPGSLGLESLLQLLKIVAASRWGVNPRSVFESPGLEQAHGWTYRGQILPANRRVTVQAEIKACDDRRRQIVADGYLDADGRTIYQMKDFSVRLCRTVRFRFGQIQLTHNSSFPATEAGLVICP